MGDTLGELLRRERAARQLSQADLAELAGLSVRTVRNLETCRVQPRDDTVRLLAAALGLDDAGTAALRDGRAPRAPWQLPLDTPDFTGRAAELSTLDALAGCWAEPTGAVAAVCGTAGVGKTALAVHWAWRSRHRFPDGQLYVDLRGYGPDRPLEPADVLGRFLRALGVHASGVPEDEDERAARYRSELVGRRLLVLLDNAGGVSQIRPLLPGAGSCFTVVTSRDALAGAIAREGARRVELRPLAPGEALRLFGSLVQAPRLDAEREAAHVLVERSCGLPLAVRLVAELAAARPATSLADLAAELADEHRRLDLLDAGEDPRSAMRAVLSWSTGQLREPAAKAFRLLGLHPGADIGIPAAAALLDASPGDARDLLEELVRAHLVERDGDRFRMHDLLRAHALETGDPGESRRSAVARLAESYVDGATAAVDLLFPADRQARPGTAGREPPVDLPDAAAARAWLDLERRNLSEITALAAREKLTGHADQLSRTLWRYLFTGNHYSDALLVHRSALDAGRRAGDRAVEAAALKNLGTVHWICARFDEALGSYTEALRLHREIGDAEGATMNLNNIGIVQISLGRYAEALECLEPVVADRQANGDLMGQARALGNLAIVYQRLGRMDEGLRCTEQVLDLFRRLGDRWGEASAQNNLGLAYRRHGRHEEAALQSAAALRIYTEIGDRGGEATAQASLAAAEYRLGRPEQALGHCTDAMELYREIGDPAREVEAANVLAEILAVLGRTEEAIAERRRTVALAREVGDPYEEALALDGLAALLQHDHRDAAVDHWRAALALYEELDVPEAGQVRRSLVALGAVVPGPPAGEASP